MPEENPRDMKDVVETAGTVTAEPLPQLERYWAVAGSPLEWDCLFMLPPWLGVWWSRLGHGSETHLYVVRSHDMLLGAAPLTVRGDTAQLIGDSDLIDYSDFIIVPVRKVDFFSILFDDLRRRGIGRLDMGRIRSDSPVVSFLRYSSALLDCTVSCEATDLLYEMDLPETWEGYLALLSGRERHETRRKLARLDSAGGVGLHVIEGKEDVSNAMDTFMTLFRANRSEKVKFMSAAVESFFRALAEAMAGAGLLKLFSMDVNDTPAAMSMCFDYNSTVYLYNSGYDQNFSHLSVGLLSMVFSIRESIKRGRKRYNFLRGNEPYKKRLGGNPIALYHCEVILK